MCLSGTSKVPAVGFDKKVTVKFSATEISPHVNKCLLEDTLLTKPWRSSMKAMKCFSKIVINSQGFGKVWIGLDLFNDDTRPSGHISRPTQVNVSELLSFSKQLLKSNNIVQSGG